MSTLKPQTPPAQIYFVWELPVRIFHWLNVLCIIGLAALGIVLLNNKALGISLEGKILIKTIHVYIGYFFIINLLMRFVWCFFSNKYSSLSGITPFTKQYFSSLKTYLVSIKSKVPKQYLGHNPLGKLMITFLFFMLSLQATTGLILAGTDLYMPPFGEKIAEFLVIKNTDQKPVLKLVKAGSKDNIDPTKYKEMRAYRKPVISTHVYGFYILLGAIFIHILAVIIANRRENTGLISAIFTGKKSFTSKPVDIDD